MADKPVPPKIGPTKGGGLETGRRRSMMKPMNAMAYKCNQASDLSDLPCTCVDCLPACTSSAPFPFLFQVNGRQFTFSNFGIILLFFIKSNKNA
jgi:hypothetical protein